MWGSLDEYLKMVEIGDIIKQNKFPNKEDASIYFTIEINRNSDSSYKTDINSYCCFYHCIIDALSLINPISCICEI